MDPLRSGLDPLPEPVELLLDLGRPAELLEPTAALWRLGFHLLA